MTAFLEQASIDRGARHVSRLRMRAPDRGDRPRTQMLVEEALCLTSLPGEDQGRVYCFRRLRLPVLDEALPSRQWTLSCSRAFVAAAHAARSVRDTAASHADAVYFDDIHAPFRMAIGRLTRGDRASEWFWPAATGVSADQTAEARVEQLLDRWQAQPTGWIAVARELLPDLDVSHARRFVEMLTPHAVSQWLRRWTRGSSTADAIAGPVHLRPATERLLLDQVERCDPMDPRLTLFAAMAVVEACPGIAPDRLLETANQALHGCAFEEISSLAPADSRHARKGVRADSPVDDDSAPTPFLPDVPVPVNATLEGARDRAPGARPSRRLEARTEAAGLYFMLHVLRYLGIEEAITARPGLAAMHFVTRVLLRLAARARVDDDDPCLRPLLEELSGTRAQHEVAPIVIPRALACLRHIRPTADAGERLWSYAARRWSRKAAGLSVAEIVTRAGRVRVTPTSIDVTLPMSAVDVRIRRAGLDLNPGFVPWFGRVVRFHYQTEGVS